MALAAFFLMVSPLVDVRIVARDTHTAKLLAREQLIVYDVRSNVAFALAPAETIHALAARGYQVTENHAAPAREGAYQTPEDVNAAIAALAGAFSVETLGRSRQGIPILGLRLGAPGLPAIRLLGGHHGDEPPSVAVVLAIAQTLAQSPPTGLHLLIVPMVNPDGLRARTRLNAAGVDINRNYGFAYRASEFAAGPHAYSEPETRAVALDNEYHRYGVSLSFHSGAFNIGYPYNYTTQPLGSDALLLSYAQRYQSVVQRSDFGVLRGADWYISYGDTNDYSLGYFGGADMTVEVSATKAPAQSELPGLIETHASATLDWLQLGRDTRVLHITDSDNGSSLPAFVETAHFVYTSDPVRGEVQVQEGGDYALRYPGYEQVSATAMAPTQASQRARALLIPFAADAEDALSHPRGDFVALRAIRAGSDAILFVCADACTANAAPRRPGHYDLVATFEDGSEGTVRHGLLLREQTGEEVAIDGAEYVLAREAWLVERGGPVRAFSGRIAIPDSGRTVDVVWRHEGVLYAQTMSDAAGGQTGDPRTARDVRRGCRATGDVCLIALLGLLCARRWTRIRTTTSSAYSS